MARKRKKRRTKKTSRSSQKAKSQAIELSLHPETKKSIWGLSFLGFAIIFTLAGLGKAGPAGAVGYDVLHSLLGVGYFLFPLTLLLLSGVFFISANRQKIVGTTLVGGAVFLLAALGLIDIFSPGNGGLLGRGLGSLRHPFGVSAAATINSIILLIAVLITTNTPLYLKLRRKKKASPEESADDLGPTLITGEAHEESHQKNSDKKDKKEKPEDESDLPDESTITQQKEPTEKSEDADLSPKGGHSLAGYDYTPPPLSLLQSSNEKPTTGDLRANANVIKRTLDSFGIPVEMGEINIGPKVTRYTLKPAEGVKLSRIIALHQDLALALAAHPIRIEAPIPGKSLVGIEVPNKAAALVRLGSLMGYKEFASSGPLSFSLGRDVTGEPIFANIEKMPHLLIAGATGSGKSVVVHSMITSLLYKNSPGLLRMILMDPKRVELSVYEGIPHLISPVITQNKKAIGVFRWAINEMERRYDVLLKAGNRDIKSYNSSHKKDPLPYLLIVVDELADLMASYGREVEGSIVRLAQMARATGIHLILSTQRPSVEVITGLIKANIPSRIALQVASQVDSRTILDTSGAEKLLGGGDLLFMSADISKPKRIQGGFISEPEISKVAQFIRKNNEPFIGEYEPVSTSGRELSDSNENSDESGSDDMFDKFMVDEDEDELYEDAVQVVVEAEKASASLLQRRLKVGYARAARLLDVMEDRGIIGPGEGAKPREVYMDKIESGESDILN